MAEKVIVTGCYGQDGSYISEKMYKEGYEVIGICRKQMSTNSLDNKMELYSLGIKLIEFSDISLLNYCEIKSLIKEIQPKYVFHMAALHNSSESENEKLEYKNKVLFDNNVQATSNILCGCLECSVDTHIVAAGSCLMYDDSDTKYQNENTRYCSHSLYGIAKITENSLIKYYRDKGLHASMAILYNHESHRRGKTFVTRKIAESLKRIKDGTQNAIELGNIAVQKDWGFAGDYCDAMIAMAKNTKPTDYVLATGELHTIKEFADECARILGIDDWEQYLKINNDIILRKIRGQLRGDSKLAENKLRWKRNYSFKDMVYEMVTGGINHEKK